MPTPTDFWMYKDGEFLRGPEGTVSALDRSFVYGDGVFEGLAVLDGRILEVEAHLERLDRSLSYVAIDLDRPMSEVREAVVETARRNEMENGYLRLIVSRGEGPFGLGAFDEIEGPLVYVIPYPGFSCTFTDPDPIHARTATLRQKSPTRLDPRIKSNNYLHNILAQLETRGTDSETVILLNDDGDVTEAAATNIYTVTDGVLRTPPSQEILVGTTREALLSVAKQSDIVTPAVERLTAYDLYTADECFLTNSLTGVTAVTEIDGRAVGDGSVGSTTRTLGEALGAFVLDRGTPVE